MRRYLRDVTDAYTTSIGYLATESGIDKPYRIFTSTSSYKSSSLISNLALGGRPILERPFHCMDAKVYFFEIYIP